MHQMYLIVLMVELNSPVGLFSSIAQGAYCFGVIGGYAYMCTDYIVLNKPTQ
jgi:hypothetical protein